ncbi:MAG: restriction endonuclease subunit S [Kofleriaceae bacterium]|nr:restriction endonuclease subunit S [Kofleriaceae bacterium]MBP9167417.1 restriction endonuclease subunit S [Kofleriaceae bacterium]MBP9860703.1 restriction endonuclease subunit S [Kofleriaceae bacterium]
MTALPNGWSKAEAGRLFGVVTSGSRGWAEHYSDVGPLFVRIGNMRDQAIDLSLANVQRVQPPSGAEGARTALRPGDILISITAEIGRVAIVPPDLGEAYVNQHIALARPQNGLCNEFLAWQLAGPGRSKLVALRKGATKAGLSLDDIRRVEVRVAPLNEQRRIVAKLDEVFAQTRAAKARLERLPALIDKLKRSILAAAFRGDLTADWRAANPDVEPASALLERYFARTRNNGSTRRASPRSGSSPLPPTSLPAGWHWSTIESVGDVLLGRRRADSEYIAGEEGRALKKYIRVANVKLDRLDLDDLKEMPFDAKELSLYRLEPGDIILSEGQSPEKVGQSAIYHGGIDDLCIQATVHRFRAHDALVSPAYAQLVFMHHLLTGLFQRASSQTVNIAHLTSERLRPLPFPVPPREEQDVLVGLTRALLEAASGLAGHTKAARDAFELAERAALAKAFRGELVPQDPADEPAEVLLARLRAAKAEEAPVARRSRAAAPAPTYAAPPITLAQAAESGPLFQHALERRERAAPEPAAQDLVVAALQQSDGRLTAAAIAQTTGLAPAAVRAALQDLIAAGQVHTHGKARGTTYTWAG